MSSAWCIEHYRRVLEEVLNVARECASRSPSVSVHLIALSAEKVSKLALVAMGNLRCSDLSKEVKDVETYAVKMIRKALRQLSKEVCSVDAERIAGTIARSDEDRRRIERSLRNASSRARTAMQKKLADLYQELETRFSRMRERIHSAGGEELVKRIETLINSIGFARDTIEEGFLSMKEVETIVRVAVEAISSEIDRASRNIARTLAIPLPLVRKALLDASDIEKSARERVEKMSRLLSCYVASTLIMDVFRGIEETIVFPTRQPASPSLEPSQRLAEGVEEGIYVLKKCLECLG